MIRTTRRKFLVTSAVTAVAALSLSVMPAQAISPRSETGVTSSTIKLGITLPMTGSASFGYNQLPGAMKAYFDYVNANGGVNGRKISLVVKNDAYLPKQAIQNTQDLIGKDKVLAVIGALGTANNKAVASAVNLGRRGIPSLFVNTGFSGFTNRKTYPTSSTILPSYIMEAKLIGKYVNETYPTKKVCLLYQDDDFGDDALVGFGKDYGNLVFTETVAYPSLSQGVAGVPESWITKFKGKGCEVQVVFGVASATLYTILAAAKVQYAPKWILGSVGADIGSINPATVPYIIGATSMSFMPSVVDPKDEYVELFKEINTKYNAGAKFTSWALIGMNTAFIAVQALQSAGKNLTRKSLLAAIDNNGSKFAHAGLVPLNYSKTSNVGYNGYWFGTFNRTGDLVPNDTFTYTPYTTDSGTGAVVKTTYARPKMPAKGLPN
ncbi:MAG: ABC transporter substrate-binding protein [Actinobacteria bacterium]|nr:ABC transporter substrate-binding protein [Actinomycetota bacterium]